MDAQETKIHLVKNVQKSISMQVEDEVEIMDDSEDELVVNRSNLQTYSRNNSYEIMDDDDECIVLHDVQVKEEPLDPDQNGHESSDLDLEAERIMNKRGKRAKVQEQPPSGIAKVPSEADSEEDQPIARRRRTVITVVQAPTPPVIKIEKDLENGQESQNGDLTKTNSTNDLDEEDPEIQINGLKNGGHNEIKKIKTEPEDLKENTEAVSDKVSETEVTASEVQQLAEALVEDEEDTRSEISADDEALPSTFNLGNLAWARVGNAPYWPCLISNDPSSPKEKFTHVKLHKKILKREFHVHFFGVRVQRAWVQQPHMLKFEGLVAFNDLSMKAPKGLKPAFYPRNANKKSWKEAVDEAVKLANVSCEERLEAYKAKEDVEKNEKKDRKRPRRTSLEDVKDQPSSKRPKFQDGAEKLIEAIPVKILEENKRKLKTGFKLFQLAHKDEVLKNHQEDQLEKILSKMWTEISAAEKKYFQDKATALTKPQVSEVEASNESSETSSLASETIEVKKTPKAKSVSSAPKMTKMIGQFKKESCCYICEEVSQEPVIKCKGPCGQSFHQSCLGQDIPDGQVFKCQNCVSGQYKCQICHQGGNVVKCSIINCGRFFHLECLEKNNLWPQHRITGDQQLTCPAHSCHTCASDNPKDPYMKYNSKLVRCIRCPTAYHANDYCVAAGTVQITLTQIVCPKHYVPPVSKKKSVNTHINVTWCFICSEPGKLIMCDQCPASFHIECLKLDKPPGDKYYCDNCETGRMPLYGEIIWAKLGVYRWWPARVLHPSEVPANIENLPHDVGEFPIQFCGSNEYIWMNRGRCFLYEEGDSEKIPGLKSGSGLDGAYKRGLSEAAEFHEKFMAEKKERETAMAAKAHLCSTAKPPSFTKIKSNRPFADCPVYSADPTDKQICDCDSQGENPCGPDADCINRLLMTECRPSTCKAVERCQNQRFQRRMYPPLKVMRTPSRGWGLFVMADVKEGDFLIEYVGEMITMDEFRRRINRSIERREEENYYYMSLDSQRMLDAGPRGNIARFCNHSCDPNAETQKWTVNGDNRVGLFALKEIKAGTELTFNYQFESVGDQKKHCLCGAKNCSGFIGEKVNNKAAKAEAKKIKLEAKKIKKKEKKEKPKEEKINKVWEDLCFRCFDDGELMMCDYKYCPKVYHLACLGRDKMPREKWFCPWHHCVVCGKKSVYHCIHCPNGYCEAHNTLKEHDELGLICDEHRDDIADLIKFYRRVGGITYLTKDPNYPNEARVKMLSKLGKENSEPVYSEDDMPLKIVARKKEKLSSGNKRKTLAEKYSSRPSSNAAGGIKAKYKNRPFGQANPFQYKCQVEDCGFRTRRTRLISHYMKQHNMEQSEAQKLMPRRLITTAKMDHVQCPKCDHKCTPLTLRRHIFHSHKNLGIEEIDSIFEEAVRGKPKSKVETTLENSPLFSKLDKDGRVQCKAPNCNMSASATNIARHWHKFHPDLNREDYQPSVRKLLKIMSEHPDKVISSSIGSTKSSNSKKLKCGELNNCSFATESGLKLTEHRKSTNHIKSPIKSPAPSLMKLPLLKCDMCEFTTQYNSNMSRHKRRKNHFANSQDEETAEAENKRDEIAQEMEKIPDSETDSQNSQSESEIELPEVVEDDVTIHLSKKYSPSKITDYFKPLTKKTTSPKLDNVKKQLVLSSEIAAVPEKKEDQKAAVAATKEVEMVMTNEKVVQQNVLEQ